MPFARKQFSSNKSNDLKKFFSGTEAKLEGNAHSLNDVGYAEAARYE